MNTLCDQLPDFVAENKFSSKGALCVALVVTEHARKQTLPLNPDNLLTDGGGQVLGLGKSTVQAVLKRHGIQRVLAAEGGRTSRGSIGNMRKYVELLNAAPNVDLDAVEVFWIQEVNKFFAGKPFKILLDASMSLRSVVQNVIGQAEERQKKSTGTHYAGAVAQHLVGAKLECALGEGKVAHNSFSTSDQQSGRAGDFQIEDVAIHVTTTPGEAVVERCRENLQDSLKPIIVTTSRGVALAEGLSENAALSNRIDIFEITQFVALSIYEQGGFSAVGRKNVVSEIVEKYNQIVTQWETDPSLRIEIRR
ncbi:MAG: DUF4928 family protein [Desulfuromonadales bacterium]|nr:DUF4928 family protein [Desulfuromonadales bacterium]